MVRGNQVDDKLKTKIFPLTRIQNSIILSKQAQRYTPLEPKIVIYVQWEHYTEIRDCCYNLYNILGNRRIVFLFIIGVDISIQFPKLSLFPFDFFKDNVKKETYHGEER